MLEEKIERDNFLERAGSHLRSNLGIYLTAAALALSAAGCTGYTGGNNGNSPRSEVERPTRDYGGREGGGYGSSGGGRSGSTKCFDKDKK